MLNAERGDCATVLNIIEQQSHRGHADVEVNKEDSFDINCTDPLGRTALSIAIINENPEMMEVLLENRIKVRDT